MTDHWLWRRFSASLHLLPLAEIDLSKEASSTVTASDASEKGGGVTKSCGLTRRGRVRLAEAKTQAGAKTADKLLLVEP